MAIPAGSAPASASEVAHSASQQATGVIEGFSIVFCDLKTLLETGTSAGLVRDKAELIESAIRAGSGA